MSGEHQPPDTAVVVLAAALVLVASAVAVGVVGAVSPAANPSAVDGDRVYHPTPGEGGGTLDTTLVANGSVVNANRDTPPGRCEAVRGTREVTIHAGREFAAPKEAFSYDRDRLEVAPCTRVVVTVVNHDDVRHQWMVHGLPTDTYPMGMFSVEVADRGSVTATFVAPADPGRYRGHCSLPQHEQKGMVLPLVVEGASSTTTPATTGGATGGSSPGFGTLAAVVALAAAGVLFARRT